MANYIHVPHESPAVPKIDVTVEESDYRSGALKLIKELRPSWKPSEVKLKVWFGSCLTFCCSFGLIPYGLYSRNAALARRCRMYSCRWLMQY